ncbi:hypothetical protein [Streptomyces sp. NPDC048419]|uniref:hypothetical protein n=1 Tax=Streptomyces sp. NPDC048419 TaxID=3365547 RepID=UPI003724C018
MSEDEGFRLAPEPDDDDENEDDVPEPDAYIIESDDGDDEALEVKRNEPPFAATPPTPNPNRLIGENSVTEIPELEVADSDEEPAEEVDIDEFFAEPDEESAEPDQGPAVPAGGDIGLVVAQLREARETRVRNMAAAIYHYLDKRKWRRKNLERVLAARSRMLETALSATVGLYEFSDRVEALRRTYETALQAQLALFNPEESQKPEFTGQVSSISARIEYYEHLIHLLEQVQGSQLAHAGALRLKIAGDVAAYRRIVESLRQLRDEAVALSTQVPVVPAQDEFRALCVGGMQGAIALGENVALYVKEGNKVGEKYRKLAALGATTGTALVRELDSIVRQATKDYATAKKEEIEKDREQDQSRWEQAQGALVTLDNVDRATSLGLGLGRAYATSLAPVFALPGNPIFAAAGLTQAGVKRFVLDRQSQAAYDKLVQQAKENGQSLLEAMQQDGTGRIGKGAIARMEANFNLALGLAGFAASWIPIPGIWDIITGTLSGIFGAYKDELEKNLETMTSAEREGIGKELADRLLGVVQGEAVPGTTAVLKHEAGKLTTGTIGADFALSAGLANPAVALAVRIFARCIMSIFPPDLAKWLSPDDIARIVSEAYTIPEETLRGVGITVDAPGYSGAPEDKRVEEKKTVDAGPFVGLRFGNGGQWAFQQLGGAHFAGGSTQYPESTVTYTTGSGRVITFAAQVEIHHTGGSVEAPGRVTGASMQLMRVTGGAETSAAWDNCTIFATGYHSGDIVHGGTWYRPFMSTYVFIGGDGEVRIVDPSTQVMAAGESRRKSVTEILGMDLSSSLPLRALGIDTTHAPTGTGVFPVTFRGGPGTASGAPTSGLSSSSSPEGVADGLSDKGQQEYKSTGHTGNAFVGLRFGNGHWTFTQLRGGRAARGSLRYSDAIVAYSMGGGRVIKFAAMVEIFHDGRRATKASMRLLDVLSGAEQTGWQNRVITDLGFSQGITMHSGRWYRPFGDTYVFIGVDNDVRIVDPDAEAMFGVGSVLRRIAEILSTDMRTDMPLKALGIDTLHGTDGTGVFPVEYREGSAELGTIPDGEGGGEEPDSPSPLTPFPEGAPVRGTRSGREPEE